MNRLLLLSICLVSVQSFVAHQPTWRQNLLSRRGSLDYEYIPPEISSITTEVYPTNLSSAYPPGTPAGLRGEAVRSALTSGKCIAWSLNDSPFLSQGWIRVDGKGTLDFLNNKVSNTVNGSFTQACLLSPKGKVVDVVGVALESPTRAYILTSPGHDSSTLYNRLDPLIFPMDQVTLTKYEPRVITIFSSKLQHVRNAIAEYVLPLVDEEIQFSPDSTSSCMFVSDEVTILPHGVLPTCAGHGYTVIITNPQLGNDIWEALTGDANPHGPIGIGPLEYETLRIESGLPSYRSEYGNEKDNRAPGPLELHLSPLLDLEKGCYLGQEGVASVVKNPRGPPRLLYSVVFDDESNVYETDNDDNLTTIPQVGQELCVLGSNEEISVGTITSIAEPSGTGDATIVGLALVRRSDSILKQMQNLDLEVGESSFRETNPAITRGQGIIAPPPLDPLDGLEVIVGGTFTVGKLRMVPSRRFRLGQNMFDDSKDKFIPPDDEGSVMGVLNPTIVATPQEEDEIDVEKAQIEAEKAQAEAKAAAEEAKRKEAKLEMLKKRAEEAMARRKKKKAS
jgi:folate-binding Fe-S cluster repair protein YgfZ